MPLRRFVALRITLTLPFVLACTGGCIDLARQPGDGAPRSPAALGAAPEFHAAVPIRALPPELLAAVIAAIRG